MRHIDFTFDGRTYALSFTAEALFTVYDKYGVCDDLFETTGCMEPTAEGWKACCWLAALMAAQGELQRRARGEEPQEMLTMEELRCGVMPSEAVALRLAVRDAVALGFKRDIQPPDADQEVNLVLREREKKTKPAGSSAPDTLLSLLSDYISARQTRSP